MIPRRPTHDVVCPQPSAIIFGGTNRRERVVSRNVEDHCYQDCPTQVKQTADEQTKCAGSLPPRERRDCQETQPAAVPKKTVKNAGLTTTIFMDCMAAIP